MKKLDNDLLNEFRSPGPCEWCLAPCPIREPHHLVRRGMGGGSQMDVRINLMGLCSTCHYRHHYSNVPTRDEILDYVAMREGMTPEELQDRLYLLQRCDDAAEIASDGDSTARHRYQRHPLCRDEPPAGHARGEPRMAADENGWNQL